MRVRARSATCGASLPRHLHDRHAAEVELLHPVDGDEQRVSDPESSVRILAAEYPVDLSGPDAAALGEQLERDPVRVAAGGKREPISQDERESFAWNRVAGKAHIATVALGDELDR